MNTRATRLAFVNVVSCLAIIECARRLQVVSSPTALTFISNFHKAARAKTKKRNSPCRMKTAGDSSEKRSGTIART